MAIGNRPGLAILGDFEKRDGAGCFLHLLLSGLGKAGRRESGSGHKNDENDEPCEAEV